MAEPKLRFTQDNGERYPDLAHLTMGDVYTERNDRGDPSLPVLTVSIHSGVSDGELDEDELGKRVKRSSDLSQYKKAVSGDLVFNMMRAWQGAVGCVKTTGLTSPAYIVAKPNEKVYPPYMDYYVQTKNVIDKFNRLSYGALDFRKRLYWDSFITADINIPVIEEQKIIADFLTTIDEVIAASEAEVTNLETQKKAVMKKIFAQEVRFTRPDGGAFPDWECSYFRDKINLLSGQDFTPDQYNDYGDGIPYLTGASCIEENKTITLRWTPLPKCIVYKGEIIIVCKGSGSGTVAIVNQTEAHIARQFMRIKPNKEIDNSFCYHLISSITERIRKEARGTIPGIERATILDQTVNIPYLEEQRLIADFLSDFDDAIAAARRELELWKQLKKALLQQLFV